MTLAEITLLVFLVTDPFGNLPLILAVLRDADAARYRRIVLRETLLAFGVLLLFAAAGERILGALSIAQPTLSVAGGVILFLISLKMIFGASSEIFEERYRTDPFLVPIAVPAIAGPAALTTVIVLTTRDAVPLGKVAVALGIALVVMLATLLPGRWLAERLGTRGMNALERFMGLLLNLVAVNMILTGAKAFFAAGS